MPLSQIAAMSATVDEHGRSSIADTVAARWAMPSGHARFWRSSACHVFQVPAHPTSGPAAYLRFVQPDAAREHG